MMAKNKDLFLLLILYIPLREVHRLHSTFCGLSAVIKFSTAQIFTQGVNYMVYYFCNNHRGLFALPLLGKVTTLNKNSSLSDQLQWKYCKLKPIQVKQQTLEPAGSVCLTCRCYFLHKQGEWYQHNGYAIATALLIFSQYLRSKITYLAGEMSKRPSQHFHPLTFAPKKVRKQTFLFLSNSVCLPYHISSLVSLERQMLITENYD